MSTVRVRFAPSPTGHLHIGGLRTAFFNWLFARHHKGTYLIRIEDTDKERSKKEYVDSILNSLNWCGINSSEPFVMQSSRAEEHIRVAQNLINEGKAYRCYCTAEEIAERLKKKNNYNESFNIYDGNCFYIKEKLNKPFVVRFKIPSQKCFSFTDLIRGSISFDRDQFDDFIIVRSDGTPTYNLVVVLDDAYMKISHVIRGEDHISNTPKQILLYKACNLAVPQFAHLPLILGQSGQRLSKRDAATSVLDYKQNGYLPKALLNYLVRLGWSHGDQEVFTINELITYFSLKEVGKKGSIFDTAKLDWLNGFYIRALSALEILDYIEHYVDMQFLTSVSCWQKQQIYKLIDAYKDRIKTIKELIIQLQLLHDGPKTFDMVAIKKWTNLKTIVYLEKLLVILDKQSIFSSSILSSEIKNLSKKLNIKLIALAQPIRIALVGTSASPGIFLLLEILGRKESIKRIKSFLSYIS